MSSIVTVADLFPDKGMMLVARDAVSGSRRHISDVPNGAACGCICFGCGRPLVARNRGAIRAHSFAHHREDLVVDCNFSGETALHLRAKEIILKHGRIKLPATHVVGLDGETIPVTPERIVPLNEVRLEVVAGEVVPDVAATLPDGRRIFIEIANTHVCSPDKIAKLYDMGVEVLEISVSAYNEVPLDDLDDVILETAPRKLILCSEVRLKQLEIAKVLQHIQDANRAKAQHLVDVYRAKPIYGGRPVEQHRLDLIKVGLAQYVDLEDETPTAFAVCRQRWQAAILDRMYRAEPYVLTSDELVREFAKDGWLKQDVVDITPEFSRWLAVNVGEDFGSPGAEVLAYLHRLCLYGIVHAPNARGFSMTSGFMRRMLDHKRMHLVHRTAELKDAFHEICSWILPEDAAIPNFDRWLRERAVVAKLSVQELLTDDSGIYSELITHLKAIERSLFALRDLTWAAIPVELLGLPVGPVFKRLLSEFENFTEN